jgi:hypothetical protein
MLYILKDPLAITVPPILSSCPLQGKSPSVFDAALRLPVEVTTNVVDLSIVDMPTSYFSLNPLPRTANAKGEVHVPTKWHGTC